LNELPGGAHGFDNTGTAVPLQVYSVALAHDPVRFPPGTERVLQKLPVTLRAHRQGAGAAAGVAVMRVRIVASRRDVMVGNCIVVVEVIRRSSEKTVDAQAFLCDLNDV